MGKRATPRSALSEASRYSGLGCMFAAAVLVFLGGGWLLDRWLGTLPVFMVVGALVGAALATLSIWRRLQEPGDR
jgi:ATP synthase protein I